MIQELTDMPEGTLGFSMSGHLKREDYVDVILPPLRAAAEAGHMRVLIEIPSFDGVSPGAAWEDLKAAGEFQIKHRHAWEKIALVTDLDWVRHALSVFGWTVPGEIQVFALNDLDAAKAWVAA
jgi:hypothetical protein